MISSLLDSLSYPVITFLMLLESTVFPVPSEFVVTPAAYNAAAGNMNVFMVVLCATIGAGIGASINYFVAYRFGRPLIYRFANSKAGHACLLNQEKVERSERYFNSHGKTATLTGRFVPVIRHLISLPAGLAKMPYHTFITYTLAGAFGWHCMLAALGWYLHSIVPADELHDKIAEYADWIKWAIVGLVVLTVVWLAVKKYLKRSK